MSGDNSTKTVEERIKERAQEAQRAVRVKYEMYSHLKVTGIFADNRRSSFTVTDAPHAMWLWSQMKEGTLYALKKGTLKFRRLEKKLPGGEIVKDY